MDDKKLAEAALKYAIASNEIEGLHLTPEELKEVKELIEKNDNSLLSIINDITKRLDDNNDKTKWGIRL